MTAQADLQRLEGVVDEVLFFNRENNYVVADLDTGSALTVVVGELGELSPGEELTLMGEYVNNPKYGAQFKVHLCQRKLPETAFAIQKYLSSKAIKGIGKSLAKKIVARFGDQTLEIMEREPERLLEVSGITQKKLEEISQEFHRAFGVRKLMGYLSQFHISTTASVKVWKKWGQFSQETVSENPYLLCEKEIGVDFQSADRMASQLGIPLDSRERIRAGIHFVLEENAFSGHTCLPTDKLEKKVTGILEVPEEAFYQVLEEEYQTQSLMEYEKSGRSFTFLKEYYQAERTISQRLVLSASCLLETGGDFSVLIGLEEEQNGIQYGDLQKEAISKALSHGLLILTGGPGTGKTTTLNAILSLYEQQGLRVMLAAPTGRAAKRMTDLTGREARTIHRLLEMGYGREGELKFVHDENNPLPCDVLIVDEMSMVDVLLFEALLRGTRLSCRMILVGDSDQLPSVGAGNLLRDLVESGTIPVVALKEIFRQARQSAIITNAHRIVQGQKPDLTRKDSDFFFFQRLEESAAQETLVELYKSRLPKAYGVVPRDDIQILSPTRMGTLGVTELNKRLQQEINPPSNKKPEVRGPVYILREQDKVMQTRNNYDITWTREGEPGTGIYNGDMGIIQSIRRLEGVVTIDFEGRIADYSMELLEQLELAYAITVHKSQGSEFPVVILPVLGGFQKLAYRNLLYTAVTRAKRLLILIGSVSKVNQMVENNRRTLRYSCLKAMLKEEAADQEEVGGA